MEENSGDYQLFIPQVADDRKPKIGMKFASLDDAFSYYNQYAREAGFSARMSNSKKQKMTNEVVWKKFVCFKEGHTDELRRMKHVKDDQPKQERAPFFRISQVYQLPDKYILKRWTRVAKVDAIYFMTEQNSIDDPEKSLMSRHSRLSYKASVAIDDASLTDEGTNFLDKQLDYILSKIKEINTSKTFNSESQKKRTMDVVLGIIDPSEIRAKGCGKRLKSSKEKSISKARLCRGCGSRGVSHDQRNCPISHNGSTIHDHDNNDDNINEEEFASMTGSNNMRTTGTQLD
ncbi:uncharacterized protein [Primulina eburnea]|uniref:uncharacterized protein isoform X2 n=1 Tax=Primulina eburnea TaxID=1245227 RepID=UPI003C6C0415